MTIRNRLKLIGLVPIMILIIFSSYFFITSYIKFEKANALKTSLTNNAKLSTILTQVGKERGLTAMYLGSEQEEFVNSLTKQRKNTDLALVSSKDIERKNIIYIPFLLKLLEEDKLLNTQQYQVVLNNIEELSTIRADADTKNADLKSVFFAGYTKIISTPMLDNLIQIKNFTLNTEISSLVATLSQLYTAKENAGLERGLMSYYLTKNDFMSVNEIILWDTFKTKANIFNINQVSNQQLQQQLNEIFTSPKNIKMLANLAETSSTIQTDIDTGDYQAEAMEWFTLQTQKISLLEKAELIVSNALWEKSDTYLQKQLLFLTIAVSILFLSFILAYLGYTTSRDITNNTKSLDHLLNKTVDTVKSNGNDLKVDTSSIENINLGTQKGTKAAYQFLETFVDTTKEAKPIVLKDNKVNSLSAANISPETNTPLNGTVGFTEILKSTELTSEENERLLDNSTDREIKNKTKYLPESSTPDTLEFLQEEPIYSNDTVEKITVPRNSSKKILIAKKFLLERRILMKVIKNLGYDYHSLEDIDTLMQEIDSDAYDIVFTDKEFVTEKMDQINIDIITTNKSKEELKILIMTRRA